MADSHYTQSSQPEATRQHPFPPPGKDQSVDPRAPRTDAMSAAMSGTIPPQEPAPSQHYAYSAPTPDPGPQGRPGYYAPSAFGADSPGENLAHGEHHHKGFSERMHELGTQAAEPINALANKLL
ncbi:hypothetical protein VUR80DRAFT_694 [Thermomyces stellatus]